VSFTCYLDRHGAHVGLRRAPALTSLKRWSTASADFYRAARRHLLTNEELGPAADWPTERAGATVFCRDPLILYCSIGIKLPLGLASVFWNRFGDYPATFLLTPSWSIEAENAIARIGKAANYCRRRCPNHELIFLCNTKRERKLLARAGERALLLNHSIVVSERIFYPIEGATIEFDAVYNANVASFKRHELAAAIPRVAYLTYYQSHHGTKSEAQHRLALLRRPPGHQLINPIEDDLPVLLPPETVNEVYGRAAVGLCLSLIEGAMNASMEYMLAGLPIVSTPSKGGRDHFFDPDYCLVVEPDPRAIRDAVAALRSRAIPRDHVRSRTLAKLESERRRFIALLDEVRERRGAAAQSNKDWTYSQNSALGRWKNVEEHWADIGSVLTRGRAKTDERKKPGN